MNKGRHAGFASVTSVGSDFVNGVLAAAASRVPPGGFSLPAIVHIGPDDIGIAGTMSLVPPTVTFAANAANQVGVTCGITGLLRMTANGSDVIEVQVTLTTSLKTHLIVDVSPTTLAISLDLSMAQLSSLDLTVNFGPPLAPVYKNAFQDATVLGAISSALRTIPKEALTFTVPGATGTQVVTVGGVSVTLPFSRVVVVPLDGDVLNIATDVSPYTIGDPAQLVNLITTPSPGPIFFVYDTNGNGVMEGGTFAGHDGFGTNIAATVNADFLTAVVNGPLAHQLVGTVMSGVKLDGLSISIGPVQSVIGQSTLPTNWYGSISLAISGDYLGSGLTFNASVAPILIERPSSTYWEFSLVTYEYSSVALNLFNLMFPLLPVIGPLILNSTVDSLIANAISKISPAAYNASGSQPLPGLPGWTVNYVVKGIVAWAPAIDLFVAGQVNSPPAPLPQPPVFQLWAVPHGLTDPSPLQVGLALLSPTLLDPLLGIRIAWNARRLDTGAAVFSQDTGLTAGSQTVQIDRWTGDLKFNDAWSVSCEVYRPADVLTPRYVYFRGTVQAGVADVVDRHRPYVRWDHSAFFHDPAGPPPLKSHRLWSRSRHSRIHRTDLLLRCEVLAGAVARRAALVFLDTLAGYGAFADVERWRHGVLCDYCFFGGPTRSVWKTPTLPTPPWK